MLTPILLTLPPAAVFLYHRVRTRRLRAALRSSSESAVLLHKLAAEHTERGKNIAALSEKLMDTFENERALLRSENKRLKAQVRELNNFVANMSDSDDEDEDKDNDNSSIPAAQFPTLSVLDAQFSPAASVALEMHEKAVGALHDIHTNGILAKLPDGDGEWLRKTLESISGAK